MVPDPLPKQAPTLSPWTGEHIPDSDQLLEHGTLVSRESLEGYFK